jgi:hypothetical protein
MKPSPHIAKANKALATIHAEHAATAKATRTLRDAIAKRRDALLPLRERLRRQVEKNDDENSKQAYQQCCARIARMDQQRATCDRLHPAESVNVGLN